MGKGALDAILSLIDKKIGDRFHFQCHRRRLNYQFSNYVTNKVNGSRVQPSLFGEDQRPDPGDGGNRAWHFIRDNESDSSSLEGTEYADLDNSCKPANLNENRCAKCAQTLSDYL